MASWFWVLIAKAFYAPGSHTNFPLILLSFYFSHLNQTHLQLTLCVVWDMGPGFCFSRWVPVSNSVISDATFIMYLLKFLQYLDLFLGFLFYFIDHLSINIQKLQNLDIEALQNILIGLVRIIGVHLKWLS